MTLLLDVAPQGRDVRDSPWPELQMAEGDDGWPEVGRGPCVMEVGELLPWREPHRSVAVDDTADEAARADRLRSVGHHVALGVEEVLDVGAFGELDWTADLLGDVIHWP